MKISRESNDNNAVEVDGIQFETFMPERIVAIPTIQSGVSISVQLGIRITNNTLRNLRFCFFNALSLRPEMIMLDGQIFKAGYACDRIAMPGKESDFPLAMPGQSITFLPSVKLGWTRNPKKKSDRKLSLTLLFHYSELFAFRPIDSESYQIRFTYTKTREAVEDYSRYGIDPRILQQVWTGQVVTPLVEFHLVQP